jgi:thiamine biosynthesis lipoprotein
MTCSVADGWRRRARPCFGSLLSIRARGLARAEADALLSDAFALAARFHDAMSRQSEESDLAAIRRLRPGRRLRVRPETSAVLARALEIAEQTRGRFDPVMPESVRRATWRDVDLAPGGEVSVRVPLALSLDGIAKGFAADRVCERLRQRGASDVIVDAGGDLALDCRTPQPVGIRDPRAPGALARVVEIARGGIASSGAYGGISDLWRGAGPAAAWPRAVTVIAPDCATADALTKVAALDEGGALLARFGAREQSLVDALPA